MSLLDKGGVPLSVGRVSNAHFSLIIPLTLYYFFFLILMITISFFPSSSIPASCNSSLPFSLCLSSSSTLSLLSSLPHFFLFHYFAPSQSHLQSFFRFASCTYFFRLTSLSSLTSFRLVFLSFLSSRSRLPLRLFPHVFSSPYLHSLSPYPLRPSPLLLFLLLFSLLSFFLNHSISS